jgi:prepilin-type processing-associated H-X9-DG protein
MNEQVPPAPPTAVASPRTSGLAIAGAVLGALVWYPRGLALFSFPRAFIAIAAIICATTAIVKIKQSRGFIKGWTLAIIGLTLSSIILLTPLLFSELMRVKENSPRVDCASNMKQIGIAIAMYADGHDGNIPRSFEDLRRYRPNLGEILVCPSAKDRSHPSYQIILGGGKWRDNPDAVVMTESTNDHRGSSGNVLYGDGHVSWVNAQTH